MYSSSRLAARGVARPGAGRAAEFFRRLAGVDRIDEGARRTLEAVALGLREDCFAIVDLPRRRDRAPGEPDVDAVLLHSLRESDLDTSRRPRSFHDECGRALLGAASRTGTLGPRGTRAPMAF